MAEGKYVTAADGDYGLVDEQGRLHVEMPDNSLKIRPAGTWKIDGLDGKHSDNLALSISDLDLGAIADDLITAIESDNASRQDYLQSISQAISMLGLEVNKQRESDSAAPLSGMSTVDHPLLLKSVIRFQADFVAEMLPADGPVKIRNDTGAPPSAPQLPPQMGDNGGPPMDAPDATEDTDALADALQKDLNHFLTTTATEYYPDTTRAAFALGLYGCAFKKGYHHPLRRRPTIESVMAEDLIVSQDATDLQTAARITQKIMMHPSLMRRMMRAGVYKDVPLGQAMPVSTEIEQAKAAASGMQPTSTQPEDMQHTIYECYTDLDLIGYEDKDGAYLPYKISIDKDSRQVLEIRRDWKETDIMRQRRRTFVKYAYIDALWFYSIGLMHIVGNLTKALTAIYREFIDCGQFSNFPGFLYAAQVGRQDSNIMRVPAGGGAPIQTNGEPISSVVMPLPYKSLDGAFLQFAQHMEQQGDLLAGSAEIATQEGSANMPVGTMLAMVEQAVRPVQGVFKGLHRAQTEEFMMLRDLFLEDPEALWRFNPRPAKVWEKQEFVNALSNYDLVPAADPNTQSQVHRMLKAFAILQLAEKAPYLFKERETAQRFLRMIGVPDPDDVLASQQEIQAAKAAMQQGSSGRPNPMLDSANAAKAQADVQLKQAQAQKVMAETQGTGAELQDSQQDRQAKAAELLVQSRDRAADRESHLQIAQMRLEQARQSMGLDLAKVGANHMRQQQQGNQDRVHEILQSNTDRLHEHQQSMHDRQHEARIAHFQAVNDAAENEAQRLHDAEQAQHDRRVAVAGMGSGPKPKSQGKD